MNTNFLISLEIMGKGMLSIFVVLALLAVVVILLAKFTK